MRADDPERAALLLREASISAMMAGRLAAALATARDAVALAGPATRADVELTLGQVLVVVGRPAEAEALIDRHLSALDAADPIEDQLLTYSAVTLAWLGRLDEARRLPRAVIDAGTELGAVSTPGSSHS